MRLSKFKATRIPEDLALHAVRSIYLCEDDAATCSGNGGLASASDLGTLPKVPVGALGPGFNLRRRRKKIKSEENMETENTDINDVENNTDSDIAADECLALLEYAQHLNERYGESLAKIKKEYMVSWMDPRRIDKLHPHQKMLANGLTYVMFDEEKKASEFYASLRDMGVDNIKFDTYGGGK